MPVETFEPADWKPNWPNPAFRRVTPRDGYWGAKLVGSFNDEQLAAAVAAGRLPTRTAADTLTRILAYRRDRTVAYWYARVTPLEDPKVSVADDDGTLAVSFEDLGLTAGVWRPDATTYVWRFEAAGGGLQAQGRQSATASRRQSIRIPVAPNDAHTREGAIATLRVVARRPGGDGREAVVYLEPVGPAGSYEVAGLTH
jgi:hypothetical protein